jgi:hypothetical protein
LGYSEKFTQEMSKIINYLKQNPNEKIKFITKCDVVCKACPNKCKNLCINEKFISVLDRNTIKFYNLDLKRLYSFMEIKNNFYKDFNKIKFKKICSECEWYKIGVCKIY